MTIRTMARFHRAETPHTEWCARDHTCGLVEHRSRPIVIGPDTGGRAVITRVQAGDREYAAVTLRVPLHRTGRVASTQLNVLLRHVRALFAAVAAARPAALTGKSERHAIDFRRAV